MTVTLPQLLLSLVLLVFLWMAVDWFLGVLRDRGEASRTARKTRECHICGKRYQEDRRVKLSECPACSAQNIRGGHRKLG